MIPITISVSKKIHIPNGKMVLPDGTVVHFYKGMKHRDNGPAEYNDRTGYRAYYKMGKLHNKTGPALINPKLKYIEYWIEGTFIKRETTFTSTKGFINERNVRKFDTPQNII